MKIAVIGDYQSSKYKDLLQQVRLAQPEETVLDLSRHCVEKTGNWKKELDARVKDIKSAHLVILASDWRDHLDAKVDLSNAQLLHKDIMIESNGKIVELKADSYKG